MQEQSTQNTPPLITAYPRRKNNATERSQHLTQKYLRKAFTCWVYSANLAVLTLRCSLTGATWKPTSNPAETAGPAVYRDVAEMPTSDADGSINQCIDHYNTKTLVRAT